MHLAMWANQLGHPVTIVLRSYYPRIGYRTVLCMCDSNYHGPPQDECEQRCNCLQEVVDVLGDFGVDVTFKLKRVDEEDSE
jgi:hypothetical protein